MTGTTPAAPAPAPSRPARAPSRSLVGPRVDAWLLGGLGVLAWVFLSAPGPVPEGLVPVMSGVVFWILLALVGTHFGVSYHLAYGQGREAVLRRPFALVVVPVGLVLATLVLCMAALMGADELARGGVQVGIMAVFTLTGWHYIKQVYGVSRVGASLQGLGIPPLIGKILRYGLYPVWFVDALATWVPGFLDEYYGFGAGVTWVPRWVLDGMGLVATGGAVVVVGCWVVLSAQWGRLVPATMWAPYVAGFLWLTRPPDHFSAAVVLGALHAVQYLACAHRAEVAWAVERGESRVVMWWTSVFGGALATGMLLSYWAPMWLGWVTDGTSVGLIPAAMLFVTFNLHHYAVDAVIWRSRDGHLRRIVKGPG
jgi:hypothetical protein